MENWQFIAYDGMRSDAGLFSCLFFIAWIFIGNFVLLNLFLAILLDKFSEEEEEELEPETTTEDETNGPGLSNDLSSIILRHSRKFTRKQS
jgi:regulatory protein YycI of two-component signal transduction system YycFG